MICGDVARVAHDQGRSAADLVVTNPPYVEPGRGRAPKAPARARARSGALGAFVTAARLFCGRRGRVCIVYPACELAALLETLRAAGLEPKRMRLVHASAARPARIAMVEAKPAKRGGLVIEPPLLERTASGADPRDAVRHSTP